MSSNRSALGRATPLLALLLGAAVGLGLLVLSRYESGGAESRPVGAERFAIGLNGIPANMSRDVLLPAHGWVLHVELPEAAAPAGDPRDHLEVTLRSERTGATARLERDLDYHEGFATFTIPDELGLHVGLFSIGARWTDDQGRMADDYRRVRVRAWPDKPSIGSRQVIFFDFGVNRDGDGTPDFQRDLERFGLATGTQPALAEQVARRIAERALSRVEAAYDPRDDPNRTGRARDAVRVRFVLEPDPSPYVTRICVGGSDPTSEASVGHVRFDHRNRSKRGSECNSMGDGEPAAGLFPGELEIYRGSPLYRALLDPFLEERGGTPLGLDPQDEGILAAMAAAGARAKEDPDPEGATGLSRRAQIERAIDVLGHVLGTIMAHETGHALGLVAEGRPGVGLFGGSKGDQYAHNLDHDRQVPTEVWLMNPGKGFSFEDLAGVGPAGPLRFRPLNYAYLRDRVVLIDGRE